MPESRNVSTAFFSNSIFSCHPAVCLCVSLLLKALHLDYQQSIQYLYSQLPMFQQQGASAFNYKLDKTRAICRQLSNPQEHFPAIHIAGTNGKGSVSHMMAAMLQAAGYQVGLYTSPHLKDFRERIRVKGEMIPEEAVVSFVEKGQKLLQSIRPSFFEYSFAMAINWFAKQEVDIAVVETGMGGRLDSTNVVNPVLTIITNIGWDHQQYLGNTLQDIAGEKAGIIKAGIPLVVGEYQEAVAGVFETTCKEKGAPIRYAEKEFSAERKEAPPFCIKADIYKNNRLRYPDLLADLGGSYQLKNIITALCAMEQILETLLVPEVAIREGLEKVVSLTGIRGRWEKLGENPLVVCDTGHNENGIQEVVGQLATLAYTQLHVVFGTVSDKDLGPVLKLLPTAAIYYFCKPDIPRGLEAAVLQKKASTFGLQGQCHDTVRQALDAAIATAGRDDLVFVGGSTFVVAEII